MFGFTITYCRIMQAFSSACPRTHLRAIERESQASLPQQCWPQPSTVKRPIYWSSHRKISAISSSLSSRPAHHLPGYIGHSPLHYFLPAIFSQVSLHISHYKVSIARSLPQIQDFQRMPVLLDQPPAGSTRPKSPLWSTLESYHFSYQNVLIIYLMLHKCLIGRRDDALQRAAPSVAALADNCPAA